MRPVVGGIIGGTVGALLWAVVVVVTGYEIGWIAWGIGALVGFGVAKGNQDGARSSTAAGVLAVVIAAVAVAGGKYGGVRISMPSDEELRGMFLEMYEDEDYVVSFMADDIVAELESQGRTVAWPEDVDPTSASTAAEYPADVWAEAEARWSAMTEQERADFRAAREAEATANLDMNMALIRQSIMGESFLSNFTPMDVIFFGLAMATAFGVGSGRVKTKEQIAEEYAEALQLAMIKVMIADGDVDEGEVRTIVDVYKEVTGREVSVDVVRAKATLAHSQGKDLQAALVELAPHLNDEGKKSVLRAAVKVAVADGTFEAPEKALISQVAQALGLSEDKMREAVAELTQAA